MLKFIENLRRQWGVWLLVWAMRVSLAALFVPTGLHKLLGLPFGRRSPDPWVLPFFDALYEAGPYWRFLGLCQLLAGVLLLIPRLATLGALLYLPILVNVVVITISLGFLWPAVLATSLMLAANLCLLLWDASRLAPLIAPKEPIPTIPWGLVLRWSGGTVAGVVVLHLLLLLF